MIEKIWLLLTTLLLAKILIGLVQVVWSLLFYNSPITVKPDPDDEFSRSLFLVLPILREQAIVEQRFYRFGALVAPQDCIRLVFVSTEREIIENNGIREGTTLEILAHLLLNAPVNLHNRIVLLNYPVFNRVVSEQLNYAVQSIEDVYPKTNPYFLLIFNADSLVDEEAISYLVRITSTGVQVAQQSSLFLSNFRFLVEKKKYLLAAFAIYQSAWTIQHEVPRLLAASSTQSFLPAWLRNVILVHLVSHGLLLRDDVLRNLGGFPINRFGGEDLGLGLIARVAGYEVHPVPMLENAEIPVRTSVLFKQLAGWYLGTLGYFVFWKRTLTTKLKHPFRLVIITIAGIFDSFKWLMKGPVIIVYAVISYSIGYFELSITLYLVYIYLAAAGVIWIWFRLPNNDFPNPGPMQILPVLSLYWLVPLLRSLPAVLGLCWGIRNALGFSFLKPKTER